MRYQIGGLIFGGAYTWRGLFSEFYGSLMTTKLHNMHDMVRPENPRLINTNNNNNDNYLTILSPLELFRDNDTNIIQKQIFQI